MFFENRPTFQTFCASKKKKNEENLFLHFSFVPCERGFFLGRGGGEKYSISQPFHQCDTNSRGEQMKYLKAEEKKIERTHEAGLRRFQNGCTQNLISRIRAAHNTTHAENQ